MDSPKETQLGNDKSIIAFDGIPLLQCNGIWYPKVGCQEILSFQTNFEAKEGDMVLATMPKSGTTWLKALAFSIVNRDIYPIDQSPLLTLNPHHLVLSEFLLHQPVEEPKPIRPRMYATHLPYDGLPRSILDASKCKIVYLCRNPLDQFISLWHFYQNIKVVEKLPLEAAFELFFEGKQPFGPFWSHMVGYWDASLKEPEKILFLKYEDLEGNTVYYVKKLAEFLGCPFTEDEERKGKIEEIIQLCSLQSLKNMEVNKTGISDNKFAVNNSALFRKGEVGDWVNYISAEMADRANKIIAEKFGQSGLAFGPSVAKGTQ